MVNSPYVLSELAASATAQIRDDLDFPHSGIYKSLHQMTRGNYAVKDGTADLSITQDIGSSARTRFTVTNGAYFRDGAYTAYTSGNIELASNQVSRATGNAYLLLVINSSNALSLRGDNTTTDKVPSYTEGDIPLVLIQLIAGIANNNVVRPMQFLAVTQKEAQSLSVGYSASNKYNEAMSITSDVNKTIFKSKIANSNIRFVLPDDTSDEKFEIYTDDDSDGDDGDTSIFSVDGESTVKIISADDNKPQLYLENTTAVASAANEPEIIFLRSGASNSATSGDLGRIKWDGKDSGGASHTYAFIMGDAIDETADTEDGRMIFYVAKGGTDDVEIFRISGSSDGIVFNDASKDINFRIESNDEAEAFFIDGGTNELHINKGESAFETHIASVNDVAMSVTAAGVVFNNDGHTTNDFRVESDTATHAIFVDAGANELHINSSEVAFTTTIHNVDGEAISVTATEVIINNDHLGTIDFRVEGDTATHLIHADASADKVAISGDGTPTSTLEVNGNFATTITTTTAGTFTLDDEHTLLTNNGTVCIVTLPTASGIAGRIYYVKNINSAAAAVINTASETTDGTNLTGGSPRILAQYVCFGFQSDGTNWHIISQHTP